jgi:hypothetical protein
MFEAELTFGKKSLHKIVVTIMSTELTIFISANSAMGHQPQMLGVPFDPLFYIHAQPRSSM